MFDYLASLTDQARDAPDTSTTLGGLIQLEQQVETISRDEMVSLMQHPHLARWLAEAPERVASAFMVGVWRPTSPRMPGIRLWASL